MCEKVGFCTEKTANTTKNLIRKTSRKKQIPYRAYFCTKCGQWHLTSKHKPKYKHEHLRQTLPRNFRENGC